MNAIQYLINVVLGFYLILVLLRIWLQMAGADYYNPLCQFTVKATQPVLAPLRRALPSLGPLDTGAVLLALCVSCTKWMVPFMLQGQVPDWLQVGILGTLSCFKEVGTLLFWMLIIRAVLSWFSQGYNPFEMILAQLTEPFLAPIRRVLPNLGGLDLSPMILIVALNFINIFLGDMLGQFWHYA